MKNRIPLTSVFTRRFQWWCSWLAWFALWLVSATSVITTPGRTVTGAYREGALAWFNSQPLYNGTGTGFIYLPQSALFFLPFALCPAILGDILWRLLTIGVFAAGIQRFSQLAENSDRGILFPRMTCLCIPLAFDCARNGQATLLMGGFMLGAAVALAEKRWPQATLWLLLGFIVKPLIVPFLMIAAVLYRPLRWRLMIGIAGVMLMPFLFQQPHYVFQQYKLCWNTLHKASELGITRLWSQLFGLLKIMGCELNPAQQTLGRLLAALIVLLLCWFIRRRCSAEKTAIYVFTWVVCFILLFNPRTENCTYALLAPSVSLFAVAALNQHRNVLLAGVYLSLWAGLLGSYELAKIILPSTPAFWLAPLCGCLFVMLLAVETGYLLAGDGSSRRRYPHYLSVDKTGTAASNS